MNRTKAETKNSELLDACKTLLEYAEKLLEVSESIDGIIESRVNAEYDIERAREAIFKASE